MNDKNSQFKTSDFYLSAFLLSQGFELLDIDKSLDPHKALFIFQDKDERQKLIEDFLFGRAQIEPKDFVSAIKELKQLLYSNYKRPKIKQRQLKLKKVDTAE